MTINRRVEEVVISTYATKGNLQRIRVTIDRDGTYSYSEWHRLRLVGRGANYPTRSRGRGCHAHGPDNIASSWASYRARSSSLTIPRQRSFLPLKKNRWLPP